MNRISYLLLFLFIGGCTPYYNTFEVNYEQLNNIDKQVLEFHNFENIRIDFTGQINFDNKKYKIKGNFKIYNSEHFQLQIISKTLGIEIIKAEFFKDNVLFIDKLNKRFFNGKTDQFKFLTGLDFNSNQILQILFGRVVLPINEINCNSINNKCSYNYNKFKGEIIFNNRGYLSKHSINSQQFSINFSFEDYLKRSNIPEKIACHIKQGTDFIDFYLNIENVKTCKLDLKKINIPINYKNINVN